MIDIHCHILPYVDDGAETMDDALEMARQHFDNLRFRFEVRFADDIPVGTAPDHPLGAYEAGSNTWFRFRFPTTGLTRGTYKVFLVLFEKNEFGTGRDLDLVLPAFHFEIMDQEQILWNTAQWGHIRFPDLEFEQL